MNYNQHNPHDRVLFEENVKDYVHHLELRLNLLQSEVTNVEEMSKKALQTEVDELRRKKDDFVHQASIASHAPDEQWVLIYYELDRELDMSAKAIEKAYKSIKNSFSYQLEEAVQ